MAGPRNICHELYLLKLVQMKLTLFSQFRRYAPNDADLARLEKKARTAKVGLWSMPNPVAPWEFRRR